MSNLHSKPPRFIKYHWLMMAVSILVLAGFFFFPPISILYKTHAIGYAICHQIPVRTFHINGTPLPLCARCTGIYLSTFMGLVGLTLWGRWRFVALPPTSVLLLLVGFIAVMGFDGLNSYLSFFPGAPYLYEPKNWLRLTTGALHGLALSVIVFPIINGGLWHRSCVKNKPVIKRFKELLPFLAGVVVIILMVLWLHPLMLYPLTILSTAGLMLMLGLINTMFVLLLTRREGYARSWRDIVLPITMGLAISFLMIGGMDWLRATLTRAMGIPF